VLVGDAAFGFKRGKYNASSHASRSLCALSRQSSSLRQIPLSRKVRLSSADDLMRSCSRRTNREWPPGPFERGGSPAAADAKPGANTVRDLPVDCSHISTRNAIEPASSYARDVQCKIELQTRVSHLRLRDFHAVNG
jgi:hypothetical protein